MNGAANNPQMVLVWRGDKRSVSFAEEEQSSKKTIITVDQLENKLLHLMIDPMYKKSKMLKLFK